MADKFGIPALDDLIRSVEKAFGRGTLMQANGDAVDKTIETIPTGSFALDRALGIGGLPKGRIIEIYGLESSGKTTMALSAIAQAQKQGAIVAFVDAEHALDLRYARDLGVDCSKMLLSQPDCGEQAMDVVEALVRSGQVGVVVVDSVAALTPKAEIDGEMGDNHVGLQARLMSRAMRKLASLAHQTGTTLIFISRRQQLPEWCYSKTTSPKHVEAMDLQDVIEGVNLIGTVWAMAATDDRIVIAEACGGQVVLVKSLEGLLVQKAKPEFPLSVIKSDRQAVDAVRAWACWSGADQAEQVPLRKAA